MAKHMFIVVLLALVLAQLCTTQQQQLQQQPDPTEALKTMLKAQVSGPNWLLSRGYNGDIHTKNWRRLAQKLATPGSMIQIVTLGGSVTQGHLEGARNGSWVEQLEVWLQAAFPAVRFETLNLARGATDVTAASTCWYNHVPFNADLVFIEYSANGCTLLQCTSIMSPLVANYESLIRRVMRKAPQAALMSFAIFGFKSYANVASQDSKATDLPSPWYNTGEDMHAVLARRYGVPLVSARNALYDMLWDEAALKSALGYGRADIMQDDNHPAFIGHDLYGRGLVAWAMRYILSRELWLLSSSTLQPDGYDAASWSGVDIAALNRAQRVSNNNMPSTSSSSDAVVRGYVALPTPISPVAAREADGDTFCAEGASFKDHAVTNSVMTGGWEWVDDTSTTNMQYCDHFNCHKLGYRATGAMKSLDILVNTNNVTAVSQLESRALVIFFTRSPHDSTQGIALVSCISGCSCTPFELDGYNTDYYSQLGAGSTQVTGHPRCLVRVTILDKTNSGGRIFKVDGVAVVPYTDTSPITWMDNLLLNRALA